MSHGHPDPNRPSLTQMLAVRKWLRQELIVIEASISDLYRRSRRKITQEALLIDDLAPEFFERSGKFGDAECRTPAPDTE